MTLNLFVNGKYSRNKTLAYIIRVSIFIMAQKKRQKTPSFPAEQVLGQFFTFQPSDS